MTHLEVSTAVSYLAIAPPAVAQHQSADWGLVQAEQVDIIRHEPFSYEFKGPRHLLVASDASEGVSSFMRVSSCAKAMPSAST